MVVVWLHILGPYWYMCVALFGSSLLPNSATHIPPSTPTQTPFPHYHARTIAPTAERLNNEPTAQKCG